MDNNNNEVYIFQDKEKKFTLSVKKEFLEICPNPEQYTSFELNSEYNMFTFLHNETIPAIVRHRDNRIEFWMNGYSMAHENPEVNEKMINNYKFNNKLNQILDDEA